MPSFRILPVLALGLTVSAGAPPVTPPDRGISLTSPTPAPAEARLALVIGNGSYRTAPLRNPPNDAAAMAAALRACGFRVTLLENATRERMFTALREFGTGLQGGGVGLFYFAGHGMQVKGRNYLVPVDADVATEDEVAYTTLDAEAVLAKMETAHNRLNIVILDACRNNPFARSSRGAQQGLAQMDAPAGTYIAFATSPGRTAADGTGANGLYTQHLLAQMAVPGTKVEDVFKRVRSAVLRDSQGLQVPWESSSITGDFFFTGRPEAAPLSEATAVELAYWETVKAGGSAAEFQAYLTKYPKGAFVELATARLAELQPPETGPATPEGSAEALFQEAGHDQHGEGRPVDLDRADRLYRRAAELGHLPAMLALAMNYVVDGPRQNQAEASRFYRMAAEAGGELAMLETGLRLERGIGQDQDAAGAALWYRKAADLGNHPAQKCLGLLYLRGEGVAMNPATGFSWIAKAAAGGDADGQNELGILYQNGTGVKRDPVKAAEWYRKSAQAGCAPAMSNLGWLYEAGVGVPKDARQAVAWYRKGAEAGNATAQVNLGTMLNFGTGVAMDLKEAAAWYRKAADQGFARGQVNLGVLLRDGQGVPQDAVEAARWFKAAAEQGDTNGQIALGDCYKLGQGVDQDDNLMLSWYRLAANSGQALPQYLMGWACEEGRGITKSRKAALEWYAKAAAQGYEQAKEALARLGGRKAR